MKARTPRILLVAACLTGGLLSAVPTWSAAQSPRLGADEVRGATSPERGPWWTLWSWPSPHDRAIVAMTTVHVYSLDEGFANNWAFGAVADGYFGATFITTHGPRGWAAGFERAWVEGAWGPIRTMAGFRAGLVYGYDHRLGWVADKLPILPSGQPVLMARTGPVTMDLTYTWVVVSLTFGLAIW